MVNLSRARYEDFLRIAEDLASRDYLYDLHILIGKVDANQVYLVLSKHVSGELQMGWQVSVLAQIDSKPSQVGPMINVSISTEHSRSMTSGQYMDWINFSMRSKLVIDILVRRMQDALRGVHDA